MKTFFGALLAAITLVTCLLGPAPVLAQSSPQTSLTAPHSIAVMFMTKNPDAKAKKIEGRLQSASGDLTGNTGDKIKGAAKQVQGSALGTVADAQKGAKAAKKSISDSARGFGNKIADKIS